MLKELDVGRGAQAAHKICKKKNVCIEITNV